MAEKRTAKYWNLVHKLLYSGTQATQNPRDSRSRIDIKILKLNGVQQVHIN